MHSKHLNNSRQLEIDTDFLQNSPSSNIKQYYNQNLESKYNNNQEKSSKIRNASRNSISIASTAILTIQNTMKTLILKRMFSAWMKIRSKSITRQEDLSGQNFQGFSIQYQNQFNQTNQYRNGQGFNQNNAQIIRNFGYSHFHQSHTESQSKSYSPNLRISPDVYTQSAANASQIRNQSVSADNLRLCFNSPKQFETTMKHQDQTLKSFNSKVQTNLSIEKQHEARLNFHISQMKEINKAYSIKSKQNSQQIRKYQSLSQRSQDALSQSRALLLREIAQKLKRQNSRNSHSVILDNFNAKKIRYHSNQYNANRESDYLGNSTKPEGLNLNLNAFEEKITGKLNKLQLMMSNIKRQHQKIQGGPIVQKKKIKIDRSRQQYFEQQDPNQRRNRFQEESERQYYLKQMQKLKHELNEVKMANKNIWNYAQNVESLRERQYYDNQRILAQAIQNQRRKAKSVSDQLENRYRERSQKGFAINFKHQQPIYKSVSYVRSHAIPNPTIIRPTSQPSTNLAPSYNIPRYSQAHSQQIPFFQRFQSANDTTYANRSRKNSNNRIINSRVIIRPGSVPVFFNKKVFHVDSLRQSMHIMPAPVLISHQKNYGNQTQQNRYPEHGRVIEKNINLFYPYIETKNVKKGHPNLIRTSNTSQSNQKLVSGAQKMDMSRVKNIVFQNAPIQNNSSTNIVSSHTLTKENSEMLCTFWPFIQESRRQI